MGKLKSLARKREEQERDAILVEAMHVLAHRAGRIRITPDERRLVAERGGWLKFEVLVDDTIVVTWMSEQPGAAPEAG